MGLNVKLSGTIYGFLYRNGRYEEDEYYVHFYDSKISRDNVADYSRKSDSEIIKFEIKVRDLMSRG